MPGGLSRAADLIIAPQCPEGHAIGRHEPDQLVLASGRPVLTLPVDWTGPKLGTRALVAWNGKREAARAVFDALPLLKRSEAVRVLAVRETAHEQLGQFTPGDEIAATLSRHGVEVDVAAVHCERASVSEEIRAARTGICGGPPRHGLLRPFPSPRDRSSAGSRTTCFGMRRYLSCCRVNGQRTASRDLRSEDGSATPP